MGWSSRRFRWALVGFGLCGMLAGSSVTAEVTTERSASIVVFPKVVFQGETSLDDTEIQVSNTSNSVVYAHCFYVNAALEDPTLPPGPDNRPLWQEVDFDIMLTKQQPTHWLVSEGRVTNPFDPACGLRGECIGGANDGDPCEDTAVDCPGGLCSNTVCSDAGFDPGRVPPVPPGFTGELKCIEVDQSGAPISGNHLKGEATMLTTSGGDPVLGHARKYNAIGILGFDTNNSDSVLCLGGGASAECPAGAEYQGCPDEVFTSHYAENAREPVSEEFGASASSVNSELTLVPCAQNLERQQPGKVIVQFAIYNEFEEPFSTSTTVECWGNFELAEVNPVFTIGSLGSRFVQTRMSPAGNDPGFVGVLEEIHQSSPAGIGRAALNLHVRGERATTDFIVLPELP